MTDSRARPVLSYTREQGGTFTLRLACRHIVRRRYALKPPPRVICPHCPAKGGLGNSDFHAGRINARQEQRRILADIERHPPTGGAKVLHDALAGEA